MIKILSQNIIFRYILSGGTAAIVDLAILFTLNTIFGIYYLISAALAYLGAFFVSFTLQKFWTFKSDSRENMHIQIAAYMSISITGLLINTILMYIFVEMVHFTVIISQIFSGAIVACFTFFLSRKLFLKYKTQ